MGCYQCGSPQGDSFKLCPSCIGRRKAERAQTTAQAISQIRPSSNPDGIERLTSSWRVRALGILMVFLLFFSYLMISSPVAKFGALPVTWFAGMLSCFVVSVLCWWLIWARMIVFDPMWAVGSLFVPILVLRYVILRWEEVEVRWYVAGMLLCFCISLGCANQLARELGITTLQAINFYNAYLAGYGR